ncbi:glycoside hydrolase family 18 protein [Peniophora sp. CONT]|nr:glycoside hydrolase family 18 protein [Peniophora sp. CONT]
MLCLATILCFAAFLVGSVSAAPIAASAKVCNAAKRAAKTASGDSGADISIGISVGVPEATSTGHRHHSSTVTESATALPTATGTKSASATGTKSTKSSSVKSTGTASASASAASSTPTSTSSSGASPRFVVYTDQSVSTKNGLPDVDDIKGFNTLAISFLLASGPADQAQTWAQLSDSERKAAKKAYNDAGISVIVSAFGETESPTTDGTDPTDTANTMAEWVIKYDLDGIDVDYEDFDAFNKGSAAQTWLNTFTKTLRKKLPAGQYTISHAPVAPWFSDSYENGGYLAINKEVGDDIDWYNIQYYNQGSNMYTDCEGLLTKSGSSFPNTAVMQLADAGVDINKIVIGKPGIASDASDGFLSTTQLASCVKQAQAKGWNAGVMSWEYPHADTKWATAVRGTVFPL